MLQRNIHAPASLNKWNLMAKFKSNSTVFAQVIRYQNSILTHMSCDNGMVKLKTAKDRNAPKRNPCPATENNHIFPTKLSSFCDCAWAIIMIYEKRNQNGKVIVCKVIVFETSLGSMKIWQLLYLLICWKFVIFYTLHLPAEVDLQSY